MFEVVALCYSSFFFSFFYKRPQLNFCFRHHHTLGGPCIIEGEAFAIKEAMCEIIQRDFTQVTFESDSKEVVDTILSRNIGVFEFCFIISSIQSLLLLYPNSEVKFVKRQTNSIVHSVSSDPLQFLYAPFLQFHRQMTDTWIKN
jgi:ribonuclease HI